MGKRWIKGLLFFFLLLLIVIGITLVAANSYLASNKTKILDKLAFLDNGQITFEEAAISVFRDFPAATVSIKNVQVKDTLFAYHQTPVLQVGHLKATLSLQQLFEPTKIIRLQTIHLQDGMFNLLTTKDGVNNLRSLWTKNGTSKHQQKEEACVQFLTNKVNVSLFNMAINVKDEVKGTSIIGKVDELNTDLAIGTDEVIANIRMSLSVEELAFKKENGSFIANSQVKGTIDLVFKNDLLEIAPFDLQVNEEVFKTSAHIYTAETKRSNILLENPTTDFKKTIQLLPANIRKHLLPYQIADTFYSKTSIHTSFQEGEEPIIDVAFRMRENDLYIHSIPFQKTTLKGRFVNRLYDGKAALTAASKHIRVVINNLETRHEGFHIQADNLLVTARPETGPLLHTQARIRGNASSISDWLKNDEFFFEEGRFDLLATIDGPLNNVDALVLASGAELFLSDFYVVYGPANVRFPFEHLTLFKDAGAAKFTILNNTIVDGHSVKFDGGLTNIAALLVKLLDQRTSSEIDVVSGKLSWSNFVNLFGKQGYLRGRPKTDAEKKRSMKETIRGLQHNFQPRLQVEVDTLEYFDLLQICNFHSGLHFEERHMVVLERTSFNYENGAVDFKGRLDISQANQTPFEFELQTQHLNLQKILPVFNFFNIELLKNIKNHPEDLSVSIKHKGIIDDQTGLLPNSSTGEIIFRSEQNKVFNGKITYVASDTSGTSTFNQPLVTRTQVELEGDPVLFNDFFKTDQFFFEKGTFYVSLDYVGNIVSVNQLLQEAKITFRLSDGEVFYKPADVIFPLTEIDLELDKDTANFQFLLRSDTFQQELYFDGAVQNLSEVLIGNTGKAFKLDAQVRSPKLEWKRFTDLFAATGRQAVQQENKLETMKTVVKGLLKSYNPSLQLQVDTFVYSDKLQVADLTSSLYLKDTSTLVLDSTGFNFHDGRIDLQAQFDLSQADRTPFLTNIKTAEVDLERLLKSVDYFASKNLKSVEKLSGSITMNVDLAGVIAGKGLIPELTKGQMKFALYNVALKGLPTLDSLAAKFRMKKRFEEVLFAPLKNEIFINGEEVTIPLMSIQSNAFNLFLEGVYSYGDQTNIWVSFPLDNLKRTTDFSIIPDNRSYWITGPKIYVEVQTDEADTNKFKFRLTKKKFYKQRELFKKYKKDKRRNRKIRRAWKKNK